MLQRKPGPYKDILEAEGFEVFYPPEGVDTYEADALLSLLQSADAMLASTEPLTREIQQQSQLKVIARMGVGYDSVDLAAATERGAAVTITPGVLEDCVAEHTMAMLLGLTRGVIERDRQVRDGGWTRAGLPRLAGKTFGVIGLGRIGRATALRAKAFNMKLIAFDTYPDEAFAQEHDVAMLPLEEVLRQSDVLSLHAASSAATQDLINANTLAQMKQGAILVNASRGGLVDEDALVDSLKSGHLWGAALDVFKQEPLPSDSPLLSLPNVILSTHMGGLDDESEIAGSSLAAQCIVDLHQNKPPVHCIVNKEVAEGWAW